MFSPSISTSPGIRLQEADEMLEQNALAAAAAPMMATDSPFSIRKLSRPGPVMRAETLFNWRTSIITAPTSLPRTSVRKKLVIRMVMEEYTTASVVARPTPSAP